jgi:predicted nucleic acid-binding protein
MRAHLKPKFEATYVDTSVWCAYCFNEEGGERVIDWMAAADMTRLGSAWWTETEFASALSIQVRKKALPGARLQTAKTRFLEAMDMVNRLNVIEADFLEAAAWVANPASGLRGGDALHLAVAQRHGCKVVATLDLGMKDNARKLGFQVVDFL